MWLEWIGLILLLGGFFGLLASNEDDLAAILTAALVATAGVAILMGERAA
jgi:hypothetical protein